MDRLAAFVFLVFCFSFPCGVFFVGLYGFVLGSWKGGRERGGGRRKKAKIHHRQGSVKVLYYSASLSVVTSIYFVYSRVDILGTGNELVCWRA